VTLLKAERDRRVTSRGWSLSDRHAKTRLYCPQQVAGTRSVEAPRVSGSSGATPQLGGLLAQERAQPRVTSAARLPSRIVRRSGLAAALPTLGGNQPRSMREHVPAVVTLPASRLVDLSVAARRVMTRSNVRELDRTCLSSAARRAGPACYILDCGHELSRNPGAGRRPEGFADTNDPLSASASNIDSEDVAGRPNRRSPARPSTAAGLPR